MKRIATRILFAGLLPWLTLPATGVSQTLVIDIVDCPPETPKAGTSLCLKVDLKGIDAQLATDYWSQICKHADTFLSRKKATSKKVALAIKSRSVHLEARCAGDFVCAAQLLPRNKLVDGKDSPFEYRSVLSSLDGTQWMVKMIPEPEVALGLRFRKPSATGSPTPNTIMAAFKLMEEYKRNVIRSDQWFTGKTFVVGGTVAMISRDGLGTPFVRLDTDPGNPAVDCSFPVSTESDLAKLSPGDIVYIRGTCDGMKRDVIFNACSLLHHLSTTSSSRH